MPEPSGPDPSAEEGPYALLYRSIASPGLTERDLLEILTRALRANARSSVTGLLLYTGATTDALPPKEPGGPSGLFAQWIEGPRETIRALYGRIEGDPRHFDCEVVAEGPSETLTGKPGRLFPHWSMALERPATVPTALAEYLAYYNRYVETYGVGHPLRRWRRPVG